MPRQKLGQHFLSSAAWRERIARTLPTDATATWLEIGPGHGEMTGFLAQHSRRVIAIETDSALASTLRERIASEPWPNVEIVEADILSIDLSTLTHNQMPDPLNNPDQSNDRRADLSSTTNVPHTSGGRGFSPDMFRACSSGVSTPEDPSSRQGTALVMPTADATRPPSGAEVDRSLQASESKSKERFRVYGNLPYYITSPILSHLFRFAAQIDSIHIVIQYEVAARIVATPGHREYAYLSALCQYFTHPEIVLRIPPGAFRPPPKVNSALVAMSLPGERAQLGVRDDATFLKFLQACFSQKRKTLRNNLKNLFTDSQIAAALAACKLTPKARAEETSLPQFAQLYRQLTPEK